MSFSILHQIEFIMYQLNKFLWSLEWGMRSCESHEQEQWLIGETGKMGSYSMLGLLGKEILQIILDIFQLIIVT